MTRIAGQWESRGDALGAPAYLSHDQRERYVRWLAANGTATVPKPSRHQVLRRQLDHLEEELESSEDELLKAQKPDERRQLLAWRDTLERRYEETMQRLAILELEQPGEPGSTCRVCDVPITREQAYAHPALCPRCAIAGAGTGEGSPSDAPLIMRSTVST